MSGIQGKRGGDMSKAKSNYERYMKVQVECGKSISAVDSYVKELIEQNKNLLDEITNGGHRCTENCSLSPMSEEYTRLEEEKDELLDFIRNIENTNLDELLDIKIPEILNKFKEEI